MTNTSKSLCIIYLFCLLEQVEKFVRTRNLIKTIIIGDMSVLTHMASRIPESYTKSTVCKLMHLMPIKVDISFPQNWSFQ
jgi:uncharacterized membrane protein